MVKNNDFVYRKNVPLLNILYNSNNKRVGNTNYLNMNLI